MADALVKLPDDSANTGKQIDNESLTVSAQTVYRQRVQVAGNDATDIAPVTAADGLLVNLGTNNDVTVSGTVAVSGTVPVSDGAGSLTVDGTVTANAGTGPWPVTDNGGTLSIDDGAGSLTVDGTVAISGTAAVSAVSLPLPTGAATAALQTQPGVDIGDVTVNNAAGASAVNIQDGGNSITVDGSVSVTGTAAISAASLPLPTGASTEATLAAIDTKLGGTLTVTGGGGGVEYTEGDTDATITGGAILWEDTSDTLRAVSAAKPLPVNVVAGATSGTEYTEGDTDATITGGAVLMEGAANTLVPLQGTVADGALVNLGANNDVTVTGSVTANAGTNLNTSALALEAGGNLAAVAASASVIDDWDESDRAKVNPIAGQAGVQGGSGVVNALTQRVVLATDVALPAGTNNIGDVDVLSLPALVAGTANIGDVDVLTVPADPFGANADAGSATGSISAKLRFIAATGIPITSIAAGDTNIGNVDVVTLPALPAGTNNIGDVDVLTLPALPAGTNNIGDVDILTIAAGDNNIGNVDIVTMPNVTLAAGTNTNEVVGDVAHDVTCAGNPVSISGCSTDTDDTAPPMRVNAEGDATRLAVDRDGALFVRTHGPQVWSYHYDGSSALTDATVHASPASSTLSLYVTDIVVSTGAATAMNVFFEEGASKVLGPYYLEAVAGRGLALHFTTPKKITANTALTVTTSAAIAQSVDVTGFTAQG